MTATFYLGTHQPHWLEDPRFTHVPLFVSSRRLRDRKTLPRAVGRWALDSGGFSEIKMFGRWTMTAAEYVALVRWYSEGIGRPDFCAIMDWMCEPYVIRGRNQHLQRTNQAYFHGTRAARGVPAGVEDEPFDDAVFKHLRWTVDSFLELSTLAPDIDWLPVVQGWELKHYLLCRDLYLEAGVDLAAFPVVGVGSVCRRQGTDEIARIVGTLTDLGLKLHGFGVKIDGLSRYGLDLVSADSMAWSTGARYRDPLPGHAGRHKNCANCPDFALSWRAKIVNGLEGLDPWRQPRMFIAA